MQDNIFSEKFLSSLDEHRRQFYCNHEIQQTVITKMSCSYPKELPDVWVIKNNEAVAYRPVTIKCIAEHGAAKMEIDTYEHFFITQQDALEWIKMADNIW